MAALTPQRWAEMVQLAALLNVAIEDTDPVVSVPPPNPEEPTPGELVNVSDMLDAANGTLGIIGAIAADSTSNPQERLDLILQTLEATQ